MIEGAAAWISGLRDLLFEPGLRALLWRILGLLAVLLAGVAGGAWALMDWLAGLWIPAGDAWYWQALGWLAWLASLVVALLAGAVSFTALGSVAAAPWLDALAERAERPARNAPATPWWRQVGQGLVNALRPLPALAAWGLLALVLFLIPVVGQTAAAVIWAWAGIRYMNFGLMDAVAARRGLDFGSRKRLLARKRWFWLGFGGVGLLMTMTPLLNLLALPAATVGLSRHWPTQESLRPHE